MPAGCGLRAFFVPATGIPPAVTCLWRAGWVRFTPLHIWRGISCLIRPPCMKSLFTVDEYIFHDVIYIFTDVEYMFNDVK